MAQATPDLTEDQIEQLLSAAEKSLPDKPAAAGAVEAKKQSLAPVASTAPATQPRVVESAAKEVTLRVPQPKSIEKKVCDSSPSPRSISL